jgi:hypothetical protein
VDAREARNTIRLAALRERRNQTQFSVTQTPGARRFKGFRSRKT